MARVFGSPLELANIERHVVGFTRATSERAPLVGPDPAGQQGVSLGSLGIAWPRLVMATDVHQVRQALGRSVWGDPGSDDVNAMMLGLRLSWLRRLQRLLPSQTDFCTGAAAVLVATERYGYQRRTSEVVARDLRRMIGHRWTEATSLEQFLNALPAPASWPFESVTTPFDLWQAELAVAARAAQLGTAGIKTTRPNRETMAAIMMAFLVDLWRVTAAIEMAGRTRQPSEVLDAVA